MKILSEGIIMNNIKTQMVDNHPFTKYVKFSKICIKPGCETTYHNHHELECLFITSGAGILIEDGCKKSIKAGEVFFIKPLTAHKLINQSLADLEILNVWWFKEEIFHECLLEKLQARNDFKLQINLPSFLTPNGCAHLGHFAGPMLSADFYHRIQQLQNNISYLLSGTLGYQTQVQMAAKRLGQSYQVTALFYSDQIQKAQHALDIETDCFVTIEHLKIYKKLCDEVVNTFKIKGYLIERNYPACYCSSCEKFLFEAQIQGLCPYCKNLASGECEYCGYYIRDDLLLEPTSLFCEHKLEKKPLKRLYFSLEKFRPFLVRLFDSHAYNHQLRVFMDEILKQPLPELPISIVSNQGVPLEDDVYAGHVLFSAFELLPRFLTGLEEAVKVEINPPCVVNLFFGIDNAYLRCVIFPILLHAFKPEIFNEFGFFTNEFYQLDGKKFSTSRQHVVLAEDLLLKYSADAIRFYLAYTFPGCNERNFVLSEMDCFVQKELVNSLGLWISSLFALVQNKFCGRVPEPGAWEKIHYDFQRILFEKIELGKYLLSSRGFQPEQLTCLLLELKDLAISFYYKTQIYLKAESKVSDSLLRTSINLQLIALKAFATLAYPITPSLSQKLYQSLGFQVSKLTQSGLADLLEWVKPEMQIANIHEEFFLSNNSNNPGEEKLL